MKFYNMESEVIIYLFITLYCSRDLAKTRAILILPLIIIVRFITKRIVIFAKLLGVVISLCVKESI